MIKRIFFVIVYATLFIPLLLIAITIIFFGHIVVFALWIILGKDFNDISDMVFNLGEWFIFLPYKIFGYDE